MEKRKFWFGKYKGQNIIDVCKTDRSYIKWCVGNVKNFALNADEKIEYQLSAPRLVVSHDYEGSVWEDFDNEMTYDMMMNLD